MKITITALAALAAVGLAGCTTQQVASGVNAACAAAGVGTQIGVIVTSSIGGRPATIGGTVGQDVTQSCAAITGSTQAVVDQINAAGGTAKLSLTARTARGKRVTRRMTVPAARGSTIFDPVINGFMR